MVGVTRTGTPGFQDHFSRDSAAYARFRPRYPPGLFSWLATLPARQGTAWDCATGNGQAATMLSPHFRRVVASDASTAQLREATRAPGVAYFAALGEEPALAPRSVDLVTVAQAFHWLDRDRFYRALDRVTAPGAALAIWGYTLLRTDAEVEVEIDRLYEGVLGPYWSPARKLVEQGFRGVDIPIDEAAAPPLVIEAELTLPELLGYIRTWSALGRYVSAHGVDPMEGWLPGITSVWGDPAGRRKVTWPVFARAGRWRGARA